MLMMTCDRCGARVFCVWIAFGIAGSNMERRRSACGWCKRPPAADVQHVFPDHDAGDEDRTERTDLTGHAR